MAGVPWLCAPCARKAGRPRREVPAAGEACARCGDFPSVSLQILAELRALRLAVDGAQREEPPAVAVPVDEAEQLLGCARTKVFELIREGLLESVKPGKQRLVTRRSIEQFLHGRPQRPAPAPTRPPTAFRPAAAGRPRRQETMGMAAARAIRALKLE